MCIYMHVRDGCDAPHEAREPKFLTPQISNSSDLFYWTNIGERLVKNSCTNHHWEEMKSNWSKLTKT